MNPSAGEYVRGAVHTNSTEGIRSPFKHGYCAIYRWMTAKHLHRYLNEFTGRARICSMDTMNQMRHVVWRMIGKTIACKRPTE